MVYTWMPTAVFMLVAPMCGLAQEDAGMRRPGVLVRLYDIGEPMQRLPAIVPGQAPNEVKVVPVLDLGGPAGDFGDRKDQFMTEACGFIQVKQPGLYTFRLISDDGARFWVDDRLVIDHDGLHGPDPKDGAVELPAGGRPFRVSHFESAGGERLALLWSPPGPTGDDRFVVVPATALTHDPSASLATSPGKKRVIHPLRRGLAGDGSPLESLHPSFQRSETGIAPLPEYTQWLRTGRLRGLERTLAESDEPVVAWLPTDEGRATFESVLRLSHEPYAGQLVVQSPDGEAKRAWLEGNAGAPQACVFRFGTGAYNIVPAKRSTFEMLALRVRTNGMEIEFTGPLDPRVGWDRESYYVEQWPYDLKGRIPPTRDGTSLPVKSASVSGDRRRVFLEIDGLKESHVVYVRLLPPCLSEDGQLPWSTEAWYTLNAIPADLPGDVLPQPAQPPQNFLTDEERQAGWRLLFDGKTTKGWRGFHKDHMPAGWQVIDGSLVRVGPAGDIITDEQFDNFDLKLEWRICAGGNSGIFFRVSDAKDYDYVWQSGPEMQVLDDREHFDGRNPKTSAGSNYGLHAPIRDVTEPVGLFNKIRILADGNHVEHWLNGVKVLEYELASPQWEALVADGKFKSMPKYGRVNKGHIALQDHGDKVWYRNIKIRELPTRINEPRP